MSFFRSLLLICFFSLAAGTALFLLGMALRPGEYRGGYALLTTDEMVQDRTLRELLSADKEFFAGPLFSESSQWVLLDEFGSFARIPLDEYSLRLHPFDPRNDGYAEKLRDFFVRDGKRFVFIPLRPGNIVPSLLEKRVAALLGDIPFSIDYYGIGKPGFDTLRFFFVLFGAGALGMIVFFFFARKNSRTCLYCIVPCLPLLASLSFFGPFGIAVSALLVGLSALLWEPLFEFFTLLRAPSSGAEERQRRLYRGVYEPYRWHCFFLPFFPLAIACIVFFAGIVPWFVLAVSLLHCGLFSFSLWALNRRMRFRPIQILKIRFPDCAFSLYMLPFVLAAFGAAFFAPPMPAASPSGPALFAGQLISETDYYAHLNFQSSFSRRSLGGSDSVYPTYKMDADGLLSMAPPGKNDAPLEFPPFPLKELMDFLAGYDSGNAVLSGGVFAGNMPLLLLLLFIFPGLFLKGQFLLPAKSRFSGIGGIAARGFRRGDKKRKKIVLYANNRNFLLVRKDA